MSTKSKSDNTGGNLNKLEHLVTSLRQYSRTDHNARQRRQIAERQIIQSLEMIAEELSGSPGAELAGLASGARAPSTREGLLSALDLGARIDQHIDTICRIRQMAKEAGYARAGELGFLNLENG